MVCNNGDWVRHFLNILLPFCESEDDCKESMIINIIVTFGQEEGMREVCKHRGEGYHWYQLGIK